MKHIPHGCLNKLLMLAFLLSVPYAVLTAPFLVADTQAEADTCTVKGLPASITPTVPEQNLTCKWDLAGLPVGTYTVTATAENIWAKSADSAPFTFAKSGSISTPAGLRIAP